MYMQQRRATLLLVVLLGLVGLYIFQVQQTPPAIAMAQKKFLDGENEIRGISVKPGGCGGYIVEAEYRYRGDIEPALLRAYALRTADSSPLEKKSYIYPLLQGVNTAEIYLGRDQSNYVEHSTRIVRVEMFSNQENRVVLSKDIEYPIDWPRLPYIQNPVPDAKKDVETLYREAVAEIDYSSSESLKNARAKLEIIVARDAGFAPVYPELARYYMGANRGSAGLRQAERVLGSGLAIDPEHANSYVLLGYVYVHQGRYQEAGDAFLKASQIGTDNLWLFANWGELYLMQGRVADAIEMYRKAIAGDRPYNTYDRARKDSYRHLIDIFRLTKDVESANEIHLERIAEYGTNECFPYYYAKFRQRYFDDADTALEYAKRALDAGCRHQAEVRKVIGIAYYSKWSATLIPEEKQLYLTQARLFFAEGPGLIFRLAQSGKTAPVIKGLIGDGISVDVTDNNGLTALAYALKNDDMEAVKRIISLGGDPNVTVGEGEISLLAIAVMKQNRESVIYLIENGADISGQAYEGVSLLEFAENMGFVDIAEVLKNADGKRI